MTLPTPLVLVSRLSTCLNLVIYGSNISSKHQQVYADHYTQPCAASVTLLHTSLAAVGAKTITLWQACLVGDGRWGVWL